MQSVLPPQTDRPGQERPLHIYVARADAEDGVIEAEPVPFVQPQAGRVARLPGFTPGNTRGARSQFVPPPPNIVPARPWRHAASDYSHAPPPVDGLGGLPGFPAGDASTPPDPPPGSQSVQFAIFKDWQGWYLFVSHGAWRVFLGLAAILVLLALGKLAEAIEIVLRIVF